MQTKKITLYYSLTPTKIYSPGPGELERKEQWLREIQSTVPAEWNPITVRVTYQIYNPETEQQRKFFEGPVVEYWLIQGSEIFEEEELTTTLKRKARETLLMQVLGYNVETMTGSERRRKSTTDFTETQQWHDFLETLRETEFDPQGYRFPDSEEFWKMEAAYGYEKAKTMAIEKLKEWIKAKHSVIHNPGSTDEQEK